MSAWRARCLRGVYAFGPFGPAPFLRKEKGRTAEQNGGLFGQLFAPNGLTYQLVSLSAFGCSFG